MIFGSYVHNVFDKSIGQIGRSGIVSLNKTSNNDENIL